MKRKIQILKIVFLTLSGLLLFAFTVLYFIGRDAQKHKFSILLPDDRDSIVIPFQYHVDGVITTKIILEKDTLDFIIDTGANNSIISPEYLTEKTTHKTVFDWLGLRIRDASGIKRWKPKTTVKDVTWGDIVFNNHSFVVSDFTFPGLIGGDLLRNFCVKFDNEKNILILILSEEEKITIWNPSNLEIGKKELRIKNADKILFEWYLYGESQIDENLKFESYTNNGINIEFTTDFMPEKRKTKCYKSEPALSIIGY